jgi:DnaK suppressor protein
MSTEFDQKWLDKQKSLLLKTKMEIMNQMKLAGTNDLVQESDQVTEEGDQAQAYETQRLSLGLREKEIKKLHEIEAALDRISTGSYGFCEESDEPISRQRLEKVPWARYSIEVAEQIEREIGFKHVA